MASPVGVSSDFAQKAARAHDHANADSKLRTAPGEIDATNARISHMTLAFSTSTSRSLYKLCRLAPRCSSKIVPRPRYLSITAKMDEKFKPAKRVAGQKLDVWSIVNEAAAASPKQPIGKVYIVCVVFG